jgi:hypothetical protein
VESGHRVGLSRNPKTYTSTLRRSRTVFARDFYDKAIAKLKVIKAVVRVLRCSICTEEFVDSP